MLTFKVESVIYASCLRAKALKAFSFLENKLFNNLNLSICVGTRWWISKRYYLGNDSYFGNKIDFNELSDQYV